VENGIVDLKMITNSLKSKKSKRNSPKGKIPLKLQPFNDLSPALLSDQSKSINETDRDQNEILQQNIESGVTLNPPQISEPVVLHQEQPSLFGEGRTLKQFDVLILKKINPMDQFTTLSDSQASPHIRK